MLKIENVTIEYPDGTVAVDNISFKVNKGEKVALIGANGAGKSTLLLAIEGLISSNGKIEVDHMAVSKNNISEIRKKVGMVFQNPDDQLFMPSIVQFHLTVLKH